MPEIVIQGWLAVVLAFGCALAVTWYYIPKVIKVVKERHLEDKPGLHKIHETEVPTLGGIGIFAGFIFGYLIGIDGNMPGLSYFMAAALILLFMGIKDDLLYLNPMKKFIAELGSAVIIALFTDLRFTNLHGFLGITDIPLWSSYLITIFIIVLVINAVNLIDGIDGLAASVGIIASVAFGTFFCISGDIGYTVMAAALTGSLLVFLVYNLTNGPKKIFMGDTGSLVIGFTMAIFAIRFNELEAAGKTFVNLASTPSISIAILIIPLFDTLRVIALRLHYRQSPFVADKRHIHHMMLRAGFSHSQATLIISVFNILIILLAFLLDNIGILWLGLVLLSVCLVAVTILLFFVRKKEGSPEKG